VTQTRIEKWAGGYLPLISSKPSSSPHLAHLPLVWYRIDSLNRATTGFQSDIARCVCETEKEAQTRIDNFLELEKILNTQTKER